MITDDHKGEGLPYDHTGSQWGGGVSNWEKYTQIRPKYTKKQDQIQFY